MKDWEWAPRDWPLTSWWDSFVLIITPVFARGIHNNSLQYIQVFAKQSPIGLVFIYCMTSRLYILRYSSVAKKSHTLHIKCNVCLTFGTHIRRIWIRQRAYQHMHNVPASAASGNQLGQLGPTYLHNSIYPQLCFPFILQILFTSEGFSQEEWTQIWETSQTDLIDIAILGPSRGSVCKQLARELSPLHHHWRQAHDETGGWCQLGWCLELELRDGFELGHYFMYRWKNVIPSTE